MLVFPQADRSPAAEGRAMAVALLMRPIERIERSCTIVFDFELSLWYEVMRWWQAQYLYSCLQRRKPRFKLTSDPVAIISALSKLWIDLHEGQFTAICDHSSSTYQAQMEVRQANKLGQVSTH